MLDDDSKAAITRRSILALTIAAWAAPAAAAEPGVSATEIIIGQSITLQGGKNDYGVAVMEGIKACLDQVNAAGGVHGRRIVLRTLDDMNSSTQAEANARKLVAEQGAFVLFGSIEGGPSTAVMKAAIDMNVPFFGPMAGSPGLRRPHQPLVFPVRAEHREEFRALMNYGRERGMRRVAFLHSDSEVGQAHLANVELLAKELGMQVVAAQPIKSEVDDAQLDTIVRRLSASQAQLMFNHGSAGIYERLIRKARTAGVSTVFMAINSGSSQLAHKLGPLASGMVFAQVVPSPFSRSTQLARDYQDSFRKAGPDKAFSYGSLEGWLTARALVAALTQAGPGLSRQRFVAALYEKKISVSGYPLLYAPGEHRGSTFVDLAMFTSDQRFMH
ncbi:MAG: ABC transporter substrate-binding protein [Burkholderiaceae bacterium]|nr:ABC transporter substrate-binding protein [Burkholderiaceae bacterium]